MFWCCGFLGGVVCGFWVWWLCGNFCGFCGGVFGEEGGLYCIDDVEWCCVDFVDFVYGCDFGVCDFVGDDFLEFGE